MLSELTATASFSAAPVLGAVSMKALSIFGPVTNSIVVAIIVTALIVWFVRRAMRNPQLIPDGKQNFVELLVEFLYNQVEGIVGKKVAPRAFPLLGTLFVYILISNWIGLVPGVGTIGFWEKHDTHHGHQAPAQVVAAHDATADPEKAIAINAVENAHAHEAHEPHLIPLLRPSTADMNATIGMAVVFMLVWLYLTLSEVGVWGFIKHTFGPKGGLKGFMGLVVALVFFVVGWIEIVSIIFRPVSLSFRLYGNVFAGENLLHTMGDLGRMFGLGGTGQFILKFLLPIPFYFMEILVGLLQATVFSLLCAVYIQLSTAHDDHGEEGHEGHGHEPAPAH